MKKLVLLVTLTTLLSCKKEQTVTQNDHVKITNAAVPVPKSTAENSKLETFSFPAEVEGCSCYFAKNKTDFEAEKFVYIDDYGNNAYLKSEGKMIKIPVKAGDFDPENFSKNIKNKELSVKIEGKKIKELEEVMMFEGTMTVQYKDGEELMTPIYGECGC